ncbi:hypothetical protein LCGC14_2459130 [marine sediment metagenome]|uniref:Uncharacterized protein n=1 Tax=marine sediment metagenome TaxID=412755 RepID=A0A0F9BEB4_9ZZZZ
MVENESTQESPSLTVEDTEFIKGNGDVGPVAVDGAAFEGPDIENLWEDQVNDQEVKQMESELLLPVGTYVTVPGSFGRKDFIDEENGNRRVASFFGKIVMTDPETNKEGRENGHREA